MDHRTIKLTLENGKEVLYEVLTIFEAEGQEYIALVKPDEAYVLIYRFFEDEHGPHLENIEADEEYDIAKSAFRKIEAEELNKNCDHKH